MSLPVFQPLPLTRRPEPFTHPDWLFEIKYDGFRAPAYLRDRPQIERKRILRKIVPVHSAFLLYVDHVQGDGEVFFEALCRRDLEGVVGKHCYSRYVVADDNPAWVKIKNRRYSQLIGRDELFERRYADKGAPEIGWDVCARAAAARGV